MKFNSRLESQKEIDDAAEEAERELPDGFWELPDSFIDDPHIRKMYTKLYMGMMEENPDRDTVETMMLERVAALYAYMRYLESSAGYENTVHYRHLSSLWANMSGDLRKTRAANFSETQVRDELAREYYRIVMRSIQGFDPEIVATIKSRVQRELGL